MIQTLATSPRVSNIPINVTQHQVQVNFPAQFYSIIILKIFYFGLEFLSGVNVLKKTFL